MWRFDVILTDWFLGVSKNGGLIPKEQSEWWKMVKSRITSYWISVEWLFFSFSGKPMSLGRHRQEREALVASTPKVGRSPPGRMGTKAGLRSKLVIVELSIQFWETISSMFKGYQHRSWKMPDNQFNQHSNFQHIPRYSNIFQQTMKTCSFTKRPVSMSAGDWAPAAPPAEGCLWQRVGHSAMNQTVSKCLETYRLYENANVIFLWEHHHWKSIEIPFFPYFFHVPAGIKHSTFELLNPVKFQVASRPQPGIRWCGALEMEVHGGPLKLTSQSAMRPWEMWRMFALV